MRRLLLLRHAKTVQDSGEGDFERVLTDRGRADAALMGHLLDTKAYVPDFVLCSTSKRTIETWEMLLPELAKTPRVEFLKSLYLASPKQMFDALRKTPDDARTAMIIGHNPGTAELAEKLCRKPQSREEQRHFENLREKYPTCALTVLDFAASEWKEVAAGTGTLIDFLRPKDVRS